MFQLLFKIWDLSLEVYLNIKFILFRKIDFSVNTTVPIYGYIIEDLFNTAAPFQDMIIYEIGKGLTDKINSIMKNLFMSSLMEIFWRLVFLL